MEPKVHFLRRKTLEQIEHETELLQRRLDAGEGTTEECISDLDQHVKGELRPRWNRLLHALERDRRARQSEEHKRWQARQLVFALLLGAVIIAVWRWLNG